MDFTIALLQSLPPATIYHLNTILAEALDKRGKLNTELREWVEAMQDRAHIRQLKAA